MSGAFLLGAFLAWRFYISFGPFPEWQLKAALGRLHVHRRFWISAGQRRMTSSIWFTLRAIDFAPGSQALYRCKTAAPPTHISRMKLLPTNAILGQRSMTILTGWRWICLTEELRCASCSSSDLKLPPRPNGMPPHSDLSHGSVTNLTLSWSSSLNKQWNTSLHGRRLKGVQSWEWARMPFNRGSHQHGDGAPRPTHWLGKCWEPEAQTGSIICPFLTRISLPRLIHFLDLVLPQLMPVQAAWGGRREDSMELPLYQVLVRQTVC